MRHILILLLSLLSATGAFAQSGQQEAMERIRSNSNYRWGEARSASLDEARENAREDLISKLKTILVQESSLINDEFSSSTVATTVGAIENLEEIYYQDGQEYIAMVYVSEQDLRNAEEERRQTIREFVEIGRSQEEQLNISEALKYYTWALRLLNTFNDKVEINTPNGSRNAATWLSNHIPAMLSNISISIPAEKIKEDPTDYDRYLINIDVTYNGQPVSMLDLAYFNGEKMVSPVHCKSGEGVLTFPDLSNMKTVNVRIVYDYPQDGRNYSPTVAAVYSKGFRRMTFDDRSSLNLPISINKETTQQTESAPEMAVAAPTDAAEIADAAPVVKAPRKTKERSFAEDAERYIEMMKRVENAIRTRDYQSVASDFTPEGFKLFEKMMGSGKVTLAKNTTDYKIEQASLFVRGKGPDVAIKNGKHISKEKIVFRFDSVQNKISSVAYALTSRAENDIFREGATWTMQSRYALLQFMEDYQTAYALKRLDYIESIFSDNAIIIVGSVQPGVGKRFFNASEVLPGKFETKKVTYKTYNKDAYIRKVKEDFRRKSFIQLVFDDTYIAKVPVSDVFVQDRDVIWIELNQSYYSSNYNDKGYLALQIDLRTSGSMINVRTWTPYFVPMETLKAHYSAGGQH